MEPEDRAAKRARAEARARWPGRLARLEELPEVEVVPGTPAERVGMVRELTLAAWAMRGEPLPRYDRHEAPGRLLRGDREA